MKNNTTAKEVKEKMMDFISRWGIPLQLVTDNGRQFVAEEFEDFCKQQGIKHITSSVYHPRSNGEAERFVRTFKEAMKAKDVDVNMRVSRFLFQYRATAHATTATSPAELLQGRRLRTTLDLVKPDQTKCVLDAQTRQESSYNKGVAMRCFQPGDAVWVKTYSRNQEKWTRGKVEAAVGPLTYLLKVGGNTIRRHVDQMRVAVSHQPKQPNEEAFQEIELTGDNADEVIAPSPQRTKTPVQSPLSSPTQHHDAEEQAATSPVQQEQAAQVQSPKRRPVRKKTQVVPFQAGARK